MPKKEASEKVVDTGYQPPLIEEPKGTDIKITIDQIVPNNVIVAQAPSRELISSIHQRGVLESIVVCKDPETDLYYPIAGRRRVKAVRWLAEHDQSHKGVPFKKYKISAKFRDDLKPDDANSHEIAFEENNNRSRNMLTDMAALEAAAEQYKVNVHDSEDQKALAKTLRAPVVTIRKLATLLGLPRAIHIALLEGQISEKGFEAIAKLPAVDIQEIATRLHAGEFMSLETINKYKQKAVEEEISQVKWDLPEVDSFDMSQSPVVQALNLLKDGLKPKYKTVPRGTVEDAIKLLEQVV